MVDGRTSGSLSEDGSFRKPCPITRRRQGSARYWATAGVGERPWPCSLGRHSPVQVGQWMGSGTPLLPPPSTDTCRRRPLLSGSHLTLLPHTTFTHIHPPHPHTPHHSFTHIHLLAQGALRQGGGIRLHPGAQRPASRQGEAVLVPNMHLFTHVGDL